MPFALNVLDSGSRVPGSHCTGISGGCATDDEEAPLQKRMKACGKLLTLLDGNLLQLSRNRYYSYNLGLQGAGFIDVEPQANWPFAIQQPLNPKPRDHRVF